MTNVEVRNPHTPQQERLLSNIGHWVEGGIVTSAGLSLLRASVSQDPSHDRHAATVLILAGTTLGLGLIGGSLHHGGPVPFFTADHQQRQHLEMAGLVTGAGLLRRASSSSAVASDALMGIVGYMFLTHEQHGTDVAATAAKKRHQVLGMTIVVGAGLCALGDSMRRRWIRAAGAAVLTAAGAQLLTYKEPEGAYEDHGDSERVH